jgi:hypothetical protein
MAFVDVLWPEFSYTNLYRTVLQFQSQYSDIQVRYVFHAIFFFSRCRPEPFFFFLFFDLRRED